MMARRIRMVGMMVVTLVGTSMFAAVMVTAQTPIQFASVAVGGGHTCALDTGGKAYCWGSNNVGQLGTGNTGLQQVTPAPVATTLTFAGVAAGGYHACVRTASGVVYCWGQNVYGELGTGAFTAYEALPRPVTGNVVFSDLYSGATSTCGKVATPFKRGQVRYALYCWGHNDHGQLGIGTTGNAAAPQLVAQDVNQVALGAGFACITDSANALWCWGLNNGAYADGTMVSRSVPTKGAGTYKLLSAGAAHVCGINLTDDLVCWGQDYSGELGPNPGAILNGSTGGHAPAVVAGLKWRSVVAAEYRTCGIATDGKTRCWGRGDTGGLGNGTVTGTNVPSLVSGNLGFTSLAVGAAVEHECGLASAVLYCWGYNAVGQIGSGNTVNALIPVKVSGQ